MRVKELVRTEIIYCPVCCAYTPSILLDGEFICVDHDQKEWLDKHEENIINNLVNKPCNS